MTMRIVMCNQRLMVVRLWDGIGCRWVNFTDPLPPTQAWEIYNKQTDGGTKNCNRWDHIDYYEVVPAEKVLKCW